MLKTKLTALCAALLLGVAVCLSAAMLWQVREAAARELKRLGAVPLPAAEKLEAELSELTAQKGTLYAQYTAAKRQAKEYDTIKRNLDVLLPPEQSITHELE